MSTPLVVVGAGGFGREVVDIVEAINAAELDRRGEAPWHLLGVVDDHLGAENRARLEDRSLRHLGSTEQFLATADREVVFVVGIGSPAVRRRVAASFEAAGFSSTVLVDPTSSIGSRVDLGAGSIVCAGVRITTNITLGRHVHLNNNATVGHDTTIGDFVSLNPQAAVSGDCVIEDDVLIGVAGVVLNQLRVGRGAVVGGAACVVRDVEPGVTVVGVPARPL